MTDLVARSSLDIAPDAWTLASRIAGTDFVPVAFRGRPEAVLAAMLTGHELGIGPMQSLGKIHVIEGKPAISAELMRALVLQAGHELWIDESTATKCTVAGRRRGTDQISKVTWTMDDAKRAGLDGRQNWRKYPKQMLAARASSELARMAFPDVLAGVSYSVEELTDGDEGASVSSVFIPSTEAPQTRRKAARAVAAKVPEPAPEIVEEPPLPPLPGEPGHVGEWDQMKIVEAEAAPHASTGGEPAPDGGSSPDSPPEPSGGEPTSLLTDGEDDTPPSPAASISASPPAVSKAALARAQRAAIACGEVGIQTDDERHQFIEAVTDGRINSGKGLTNVELLQVINAAKRFERGEIRLIVDDGPPYLYEATG